MKKSNGLWWFIKLSVIFIIVFFFLVIFLGYLVSNSNLNEAKQQLPYAKAGNFKIRVIVGSSVKNSIITALGHIYEVEGSLADRRLEIGIRELFSPKIKTNEGDLIPIWYSENKEFLLVRIYDSKAETIEWLETVRWPKYTSFGNWGFLFSLGLYLLIRFLERQYLKIN